MSIMETLVGVIAPHTCIGCGIERNQLLCDGCVESLTRVPSRCYKCKAVTDEYAVCRTCAKQTPLRTVYVFTHYQDLAKELVHRMKYERARQGTREIAQMLSDSLQYVDAADYLTYVPTATGRVRSRGYDHARLIAKDLARPVLPVATLLARMGQAHQVGARRSERIRQLETAFRAVHGTDIAGKYIVLVDDVLTTGATLEAAARILKRAGAKRVDAVVFAQA